MRRKLHVELMGKIIPGQTKPEPLNFNDSQDSFEINGMLIVSLAYPLSEI